MSLHQSIEVGCLESVIEGHFADARTRLRHYMSDDDLTTIGVHVNQLLDLIDEECDRRREGRGPSVTVERAPDTGEINIIRGTG